MKRIVLVSVLITAFQLCAYAWPNNLIFTLKPNNIELLDKIKTDLPKFTEKDGQTYLGKFIHPDIAKMAQRELENRGFQTEVLAFFRARPIPMEDALVLVENLNSQEESTMLSGTKGSSQGGFKVSSAKDVNSAYFTIQVGMYSKSRRDNFDLNVRELQVNDKFYYFYGKFESIEKGNEVLSELKEKGYDDAFITGFSLGQKMNAELLEKLLKS